MIFRDPYHATYVPRSRVQQRAQALPALLLACLLLLMLIVAACSPGQTANQGTPAGSAHPAKAPGQLIYVAIGASDTFGFGTRDPYEENWATDLANDLSANSNVHLVNLGIPGMLLHQALNVELPVALDVHPNLVTIWLAVNDLADNVPLASYSHDLNALLSRLQAGMPHVRIAIANVPDLTLLPHFSTFNPVVLRQQIRGYNVAIASAVSRHHVILVDVSSHNYDLAQHPEYISRDGLHPSVVGYVQVADIFYQALQG
ncbi:MAG: GDSL-type esterase/lipase family protein [Chloroflexota bacterium]|nr:GDSL-type esterase/lipase family protein [Chloroflexota bacterium]